MSNTTLRIGIAGCGHAARVHLDRLIALNGVTVVGCADPDSASATDLAARIPGRDGESPAPIFNDLRELVRQLSPDAVAIFTPHVSHYRPAMDALQAGCHVFIEKPLSTNVQEAVDIAGLARGRNLKVGVGHQFRLRPSLIEARRHVADGAIGPLRLVTGVLAQPWLESHGGDENRWRFDPKLAGGGILADSGDHLIDALLWISGQVALEAAAVQNRLESGLDLVTAAAVRLADGTPATLAVTGVSAANAFELNFHGERGRIRVTDDFLEVQVGNAPATTIALSTSFETIDANFVSAVLEDTLLCCPAAAAVDTVRLLEAIARSAATGQVVRLS